MCIVQHVESPGMRFEGGKLDNLPVSSIDCFLNRMSGLQDVVVAFPLYSEALKFAYHGEKMIQIAFRVLLRLGSELKRAMLPSRCPLSMTKTYKEAWLVELRDSSGEEGVWSPRFSRSFNDWEVEEVERLLLTIRGRRLNPLLEDKGCGKRLRMRFS
ncbi:hypothetical protein CK203_018808 [Vitis vinifera]|uniref:Uncharacterized protein n=1 Tax=Vitis vinifera TaxID=29760 RepID=A0A438JAX6_VITVI|nr:hypothetical protein CK203_018808 [Vitis vinifera]